MAEVLAPVRRDISAEFTRGFDGMTAEPVMLDDLLQAREKLIASIVGEMIEEHRRFLLSAKRGVPDWSLLDVPGAEALPAVRWRLTNLANLDNAKRQELVVRLQDVLGIVD